MKHKVMKVLGLFTLLFSIMALLFSVQIYNFGSLTGHVVFENSNDVPYFEKVDLNFLGMMFFILGSLVLFVFIIIKLGREYTRRELKHALR